jgi:NitT/TauT family transport system substrate-binding protein
MDQSNGASPARGGRLVNSPKARFRKLACALAAPALVAAVAACSSSGGSTSQGSAGEASVTMSITIAAPTSAPVYLADSLGYFKQQGLNVNVKIIPNSYQSIAAGQIQYGLVGVAQVIQANANGVGLQQVCNAQTSPSYILAVSQKTLNAKGITASMSLKETLTKLQGEQVTEVGGAVNPGSILLSSLLKQNGLPGDWIKVVSETSNASATASFMAGQVGVVFQPQPVPDQLLSKVPGRIIINTGDSPLFANLHGTPWSGIVASKSYIDAHPDVTKKVCAAIGKADNYLIANPAKAAQALQPQMPSYSVSLLEKALPTYTWAADGAMSESQFQSGINVLASYGIFQQPSASTLSAAYTTKYQP